MIDIKTVLLDGRKIKSPADLHQCLSESLQFPDYYGKNLDALWDILSTTSEIHYIQLIHEHDFYENLDVYAQKTIDLFRSAADSNKHIHFCMII